MSDIKQLIGAALIARAIRAYKPWFKRFDPRPSDKMSYEAMQNCRMDYSLGLAALHHRARAIASTAITPIVCLDVGCGTGAAIRPLNDDRKVKRLVGLDQDTEMLALAKSKSPRLETLQQDMEAMDFGDDAFDLVLASFAYHHVRDEQKRHFCKQLRDATVAGGRILVLEICLENQDSILAYYERVKATLKADPRWHEIAETFMSWTSGPDTEETGEHKVGKDHLLRDFEVSGWTHISTESIWPLNNATRDQGCFMFEFERC